MELFFTSIPNELYDGKMDSLNHGVTTSLREGCFRPVKTRLKIVRWPHLPRAEWLVYIYIYIYRGESANGHIETYIAIYLSIEKSMHVYIVNSKVGDLSQGWPQGSLFKTKV